MPPASPYPREFVLALAAAGKAVTRINAASDSSQLWRKLNAEYEILEDLLVALGEAVETSETPLLLYLLEDGTLPRDIILLLHRLLAGDGAPPGSTPLATRIIDELSCVHTLLGILSIIFSWLANWAGREPPADRASAAQALAAVAATQPGRTYAVILRIATSAHDASTPPPPNNTPPPSFAAHINFSDVVDAAATGAMAMVSLALASIPFHNAAAGDLAACQLVPLACRVVEDLLATAAVRKALDLAEALSDCYAATSRGGPFPATLLLHREPAFARLLLAQLSAIRRTSSAEHLSSCVTHLHQWLKQDEAGAPPLACHLAVTARHLDDLARTAASMPAGPGQSSGLVWDLAQRLFQLLPTPAERQLGFDSMMALAAAVAGGLATSFSLAAAAGPGTPYAAALAPDGPNSGLAATLTSLVCAWLECNTQPEKSRPDAPGGLELPYLQARARQVLRNGVPALVEALLRALGGRPALPEAVFGHQVNLAHRLVVLLQDDAEHGPAALQASLSLLATVRKALMAEAAHAASTGAGGTAQSNSRRCAVLRVVARRLSLIIHDPALQPCAGSGSSGDGSGGDSASSPSAAAFKRCAVLQLLPPLVHMCVQHTAQSTLSSLPAQLAAQQLCRLHPDGLAAGTGAGGGPAMLHATLQLLPPRADAGGDAGRLSEAAWLQGAVDALMPLGGWHGWLEAVPPPPPPPPPAAAQQEAGDSSAAEPELSAAGSSGPAPHLLRKKGGDVYPAEESVALTAPTMPAAGALPLPPPPPGQAGLEVLLERMCGAAPLPAAWDACALEAMARPQDIRVDGSSGSSAGGGAPCVFFGCWHRDCIKLSGGSEGKLRLSKCPNCKLARYCSAMCQKTAWLAGHRDACRSWRQRGQPEQSDAAPVG